MGVETRALITGVAGFAGSHLADYLSNHTDWTIIGVDRPGCNISNLSEVRVSVEVVYGDVTDSGFVMDVYQSVRPDYVFHLAGQASVADSWNRPWDTFALNVHAQLNILLAAVRLGTLKAILAVGSADEYGPVAESDLPLGEDRPLLPSSPYAVSKVAQELLGYQYFRSHHLPVVRVRPFNHIGPRQSDAFVASSFARQVAEAELGLRERTISVGNLDAKRDFCDVRDVVRAYFLALTAGQPGEVYNIGSGKATRIGALLDTLVALARCDLRIELDQTRLRPSDLAEIRCDSTKFSRQTGWTPTINIERSLEDLLDFWRDRLRLDSQQTRG